MNQKIELLDQEFGRLKVKEKVKINNRSMWKCECSCGNIKYYRGTDLKYSDHKSCGCWKTELFKTTGTNNKTFQDISGKYFSQIRLDARRRKLEFDITKEYLWNLYLKQNKICNISGVEIILSINPLDRTASLDRIDNNKGYVDGNVQWVHKKINNLKSDWNQEELIKWCHIISDYNKA